MRRTTFPKTGWEVGVIGLGCWGIGGQWGPVDEATAVATVRTALDSGMNFLDTADAYGATPGRSEELVGKALKGRRGDAIVATKVGNYARRAGFPLSYASPLHVTLCCDASLGRLKTDYIDLYQCHIGDLADPTVFLEAFEDLRGQGKIRACGISTVRRDVLERFNRDGHCISCQLDYSLVSRKAEAELLPWCLENRIATILRGPLAMGILSGKYGRETKFEDLLRRSWNEGDGRRAYLEKLEAAERLKFLVRPDRSLAVAALQFALSHPGATVVIPGAKSPEQVRQNTAAGEGALTPEEMEKARAETARFDA
ncbi:MAG: aldo/keto reductase [Planctomycetes bacterium]|nr:aldo/keto reductase [Planctomycetota bacterium]